MYTHIYLRLFLPKTNHASEEFSKLEKRLEEENGHDILSVAPWYQVKEVETNKAKWTLNATRWWALILFSVQFLLFDLCWNFIA